jgi:hypothetical protein
MPAIIRNPSIEPVALPYPFMGVLRGRQAICLNITAARALALLGSNGALMVEESASAAGPFDTAYLGMTDQAPDAVHFNPRGPFPTTLGSAGVVSTAAMALWGNSNIAAARVITAIDLHQMADGTGSAVVEVWRRRAGAMTQLLTITLVQGGGAFSTATGVPATLALRTLQAGDYLYAQGITAPTGGAGFMIDVEFAPQF